MEDAMAETNNSSQDLIFGWELDEQLNGPAIAAMFTLQLLLALPSNLFIVINSIYNLKEYFKKSATILLFSLALSDLIIALLYMPFVIVATGMKEWIFGNSNQMREVLCVISGFVYEYTVTVTGHVLVVISVDRFMYIVLANYHHKIMSWKVTLGITAAIWIITIFWCASPYYGPGLGYYDYSYTGGGCVSFILNDNVLASILYILYVFALFCIILVTTLWSFIFTHAFLKKKLQLQQGIYDCKYRNHIYLQKVRNLIGICGALLIANAFSWLPYFVSSFYALIGDKINEIPVQVDAALYILSFTNTVANPVIQIYFRKDLRESLKKMYKFFVKSRISQSLHKESNNSSEEEQREEKTDMHSRGSNITLEIGVSSLSLASQDNGILWKKSHFIINQETKSESGGHDRSRSASPCSISSLPLRINNTRQSNKLRTNCLSVPIKF